jgi:hypothetical protein
MADDLAISVQIGADLSALEEQLAAATKLVGDFAASLTKTTANATGDAGAAQDKATREMSRQWDGTAKSIENSMNTAIGGVLRGTTSFQAAFDKVATGIEQRMLDAALRVPEDWASGQLKSVILTQQAQDKMTGAATAGAAARNAAGAGENQSLFQRIGEAIARWLGLETGKTAASDAGATSRTAAIALENAQTTIQDFGLIEMAAAVAAANAYAANAALPPVALAAAELAWGTTMAYASGLGGGLASAAGGWDRVPYDGALTELHKDEMVLPASIASPLRQSLAGGGVTAGAGASMHFHFAPVVSAVDATGVDQLLQQHQDVFIKNVRNWHRNGKLGPKGALA